MPEEIRIRVQKLPAGLFVLPAVCPVVESVEMLEVVNVIGSFHSATRRHGDAADENELTESRPISMRKARSTEELSTKRVQYIRLEATWFCISGKSYGREKSRCINGD